MTVNDMGSFSTDSTHALWVSSNSGLSWETSSSDSSPKDHTPREPTTHPSNNIDTNNLTTLSSLEHLLNQPAISLNDVCGPF